METQTKERWQLLCEQASTEHDPHKLAELIREITLLLDERNAKKATKGEGDPINVQEGGS